MVPILPVATYLTLAFSSVANAQLSPPSQNVSELATNRTNASLSKEVEGYKTVAYYVNWAIYGRNHPPSEIPVKKLNYVLYAFAKVDNTTAKASLSDPYADVEKIFPGDKAENGTNMYGCLKQINILKQKNRNLKVLLSVGGFTYSANFTGPLSTKAGRKTLAKSSVQLLKDHGFDGLDIDYEYPTNKAEGENWVHLMKQIRKELNAYEKSLEERLNLEKRPHFYLTIAAPAGPQKYAQLLLAEMEPYMDFVNLMAYDYSGSWDNTTGHNANLYPSKKNPISTPFNSHTAVQHYLNNGIPSHKLVLGMPLYGRTFLNTTGPGKPYKEMGTGSWEKGVWDYKVLPRPGHPHIVYDKSIGASYSFDNTTGEYVSYDTPNVAHQKAKYIRSHSLGGAMWWETSSDKNGTASLISTVKKELTKGKSELEYRLNNLHYPDSKYENLKNGFN